MEAKTHRKPFLPLLAAICAAAISANSLADIQGVAINDYKATPPFLDLTASGGGFPSFLLAVSRDNQMFFKAYSDYGDIDGDNIPETTYRQDLEYYGLFNPDLCYEYDDDSTPSGNAGEKNGGFIPNAFSNTNSSGGYTHVCADGWSGNFMNWASATRLDIVQKVIYGGKRLVDTTTETFLIGAWTPPDNHSFVKYVKGAAVIGGATPITDSAGNVPDELTLCRTSLHAASAGGSSSSNGSDPPPMLRIAIGDFRQWDFQNAPCFRGASEAARGFDQSFMVDSDGKIALDADGDPTLVTGTARPTGFDEYAPSRASPLLTDLVDTSTLKQAVVGAGSTPSDRANSNTFRRYGFALPVKVCVNDYINAGNKENCRPYSGSTVQKPTGMLQRYGEPGLMKIGMIATSYRAALRGGILRATVDDISMHGKRSAPDSSGNFTVNPEINQTTGIFNLEENALEMSVGWNAAPSLRADYHRTLGSGRIVAYLNDIYLVQRPSIRMAPSSSVPNVLDYALISPRYVDIADGTSCGFTGRRIDEDCGSWGNPYAELIYEAVNYLAGGAASPGFTGSHRTSSVARATASRALGDLTWGHPAHSGSPPTEADTGVFLPWGGNAGLLAGDLACSPMNILAINSSVISHDFDNIPANADITSGSTTDWGMGVIETATNEIGTSENLNTKSFILPDPTSNLNTCSYRTLGNLADVRGLCPNAPAMQGTYLSAGAAYYAHTTDLRTDLDGEQTINFLGIEMRPNVPQITVPLSAAADAATVLLQPGYARRVLGAGNRTRLLGGTQVNHHNGRLTQFQAIYPPRWTIPGCRYEGVYLVGWEDGLSGTDFDVDFLGYLDFKVHVNGSSCPFSGNSVMVEVGTQMSTASQGTNQSFFGFTIAGTGQDGFHAYTGNYGGSANARAHIQARTLTEASMSWPVPGNVDPSPGATNPVPSCGTGVRQWDPTSNTPHSSPQVIVNLVRPDYTDRDNVVSGCAWNSPRVSHLFVPSSGGSPSLLRSPLYYAAKWGGFKDSDGNKKPNLESEWDALNNRTGLAGADGEPDNYFLVTDPTILDSALERALIQGGVNQRTASGTAAALVANEREGLGAVFQALFEPSYTDDADRTATWFGTLHALFIDSRGLLREDDGDGVLEGYDVDKVVALRFNEAEGETEARIFNSSDASTFTPSGNTVKAIPELGTIWNGRKWIDGSRFAEQRTYGAVTGNAADRRYITTWIDADEDGVIDDSGEVVSFHRNSFNTQAKINHLDVATSNEMEDVVRFVRGGINRNQYHRAADDVRNREIAYDMTAGREKMRLGDIINSSPAAVTSPSEAYDLLAQSGNSGYDDFREKWDDRRQMVYVGANDGMLHAFNAGFYNAGSRTVSTSGNNSEDAHALGKEMWAHIPRSLLPQLKWLIDKNYADGNHAYYMDGSPRVFDARVYSSSTTDTDHPGGWATILVAGMRLGGGTSARHIIIDTENDGIGGANTDSDADDDVQALSSYLVADITNPEEAPEILAELAPAGLNYTTSRPAVVPVGGKWYLVFGTGPDVLDTATVSSTSSPARLFFYDLENLAAHTTKYNDNADITITLPGTRGVAATSTTPAIGGHFVGGITVSDTDLNVNAEALYVTTVGGNDQGSVIRVVMNESANSTTWSTHVLLDADKPMVSEPTLAVDEDGNLWVYAGSGRLFVTGDNSDSTQQTLYGFLDFPLTDTTSQVSISGLVDVNDVRVYTDGSVDSNNDGTPNTNFEDFRATVLAAKGWKRDYARSGSSAPSQRTVNPSTLLGEVLFNTAYTPPPPADASTAAGCGVSSLGESVLIGIDFLSGVTHPFGVLGTTGCTLQVCTTDGVREAVGESVLGQGLSSLPSLHIGSPGQNLPGQVTVVVQKSTGEVSAVQAGTVGAGGSSSIDWREYIQ